MISQGVHVIYKPFDIDHMMAIVKQALESRRNIASVVEEEDK